MIRFLCIACVEILRTLGLILVGAAAIALTAISLPFNALAMIFEWISRLLDKANGALRSAYDWLD